MVLSKKTNMEIEDSQWQHDHHITAKNAKQYKIVASVFIILLFIIILGSYTFNAWGHQKRFDEIIFSLDSTDMAIEEICEEIYQRTSYRVLLNSQILKKKITIKFKNNSLSEVINKIIKKADINNYTIVRDDVNRTLRINTFNSEGDFALAPEKEKIKTKDTVINEVEPGFSYNDMEKALIKYNKQKQDLKLSEEVEPGFTYENMENAIRNYQERIQQQNRKE